MGTYSLVPKKKAKAMRQRTVLEMFKNTTAHSPTAAAQVRPLHKVCPVTELKAGWMSFCSYSAGYGDSEPLLDWV